MTVIAERKQFPLILGHKSQGSTLNYMESDLSRSTGKKTATGKTYQQPISQGQFYTHLSCAKSRDKILLLNFDPEQFKLNESALENAHLGPFLSDNICKSYSSLFCFTKTNINGSPVKHIDEVLDD